MYTARSNIGGYMPQTPKKSKKSKALSKKQAVTGSEPPVKRKRGGRPSKIDKPLLMLAKQHPEMNLHQLGRELVDMGVCKDATSVYRRPRKSTFVAGELEEIRRKNFQMMSSEIVPEALKIHKKALKSRDLTLKEKQGWVQMAERAEFQYDQSRAPVSKDTVNISQLQVYQTLVAKNLGGAGETIEPVEFVEIEGPGGPDKAG
jgi:hypothetical protein